MGITESKAKARFSMAGKNSRQQNLKQRAASGPMTPPADVPGGVHGGISAENPLYRPRKQTRPARKQRTPRHKSANDSVSRMRPRQSSNYENRSAKILVAGLPNARKSPVFTAMQAEVHTSNEKYCKVVTSGAIIETPLRLKGRDFRMVDFGETKSVDWLPYLRYVTAAVFVIKLDQYDEVDEVGRCKLFNSFSSFGKLVNNMYLQDATFAVFLDKTDEFKDKLVNQNIPLNHTNQFPKAPEGFDYKKALEWVRSEVDSRVGQRRKSNTLVVDVLNTDRPEEHQPQVKALTEMIVTRMGQNLVFQLL